MKLKKLLMAAALLVAPALGYADDYVVVLTDSKVFDAPVAKDEYASKNENDQDVLIHPGMAFKVTEKKTGWDVIEYSPGLRGMIMQTVEASPKSLKTPVAGKFKVANNQNEVVTISQKGQVWTLLSGKKSFSGRQFGNVVVFFDPNVNAAYTYLNLNGSPYVYNYSNELTKFF